MKAIPEHGAVRWSEVVAFVGGHRYFTREISQRGDWRTDAESPGNARHYIADDSGTTPDTTDDGDWYVDTSRRVTIGKFSSIPIRERTGATSETPVNADEAFAVAHMLRMEVRAHGENNPQAGYRIERIIINEGT